MVGRFTFSLALLLVSWLPALAHSQDTDSLKSCVRCHGQDGNSAKPQNPSISGLDAAYIESSLEAYQDGSRQCGQVSIKCKMASRWTEQQIKDAAAFFSASARVRAPQAYDAGLAEQGKGLHESLCASCHAAGSAGDGPQGGLLSGQWREYLEYAMEQYRTGGRLQPEAMQEAANALDDSEWDALLHYYASASE